MKFGPNIAIFAAHYPPEPGGISKFMGITTAALAKQGCNVYIITSDFNNPSPEQKNIKLSLIPIHNNWPGSSRYPVPRKNKADELLRSLELSRIDRVIALTRFHPTTQLAAKFAQTNNIPLYLLECGANPLTLNNPLLDIPLHLVEDILTSRVRKSVFRWGAMSRAGIGFLQNQYNIKGEFIWPCSIYVPRIVNKLTQTDRIVITYSGRIENLKGEKELAHSFIVLARKYPNIYLNFLGDGSYLPTLKRQFTHPRIKYYGYVDQDTVAHVNLSTDIAVCATRFPDGAVPNAILEAGAAKVACITSPNGGFTDLISDGYNGILTNPDLSDMKDCLQRLIVSPKLRYRLAENLYADIKKNYHPDMVAHKIIIDLGLDYSVETELSGFTGAKD